jgi:hypothetical protein
MSEGAPPNPADGAGQLPTALNDPDGRPGMTEVAEPLFLGQPDGGAPPGALGPAPAAGAVGGRSPFEEAFVAGTPLPPQAGLLGPGASPPPFGQPGFPPLAAPGPFAPPPPLQPAMPGGIAPAAPALPMAPAYAAPRPAPRSGMGATLGILAVAGLCAAGAVGVAWWLKVGRGSVGDESTPPPAVTPEPSAASPEVPADAGEPAPTEPSAQPSEVPTPTTTTPPPPPKAPPKPKSSSAPNPTSSGSPKPPSTTPTSPSHPSSTASGKRPHIFLPRK